MAKKFIFAAALLVSVSAHATQTAQATMPYVTTTPPSYNVAASSPLAPMPEIQTKSTATAFAIQAGQIAGIVQACGQDVSLFISRVSEALNKLSNSPPDKVLATEAFQSSMRQAQAAQLARNLIPCAEAVKEYNTLPLLRDDYQQTILPQLNPNMLTIPPQQQNPTGPASAQNPITSPPSGVQSNAGHQPPRPDGKTLPQQPSNIQSTGGYPPSQPTVQNTLPSSFPPSDSPTQK